MYVLIVGAGAIGIAVAATLRSAGVKVSLQARGATLAAIREGGIHRTGLFGNLDIPPEEITAAEGFDAFAPGSFDYILISVKTMANNDISDALAAHRSILKQNGKLVLLQNGWGNDAAYLRHFPREEICSARVITGFQRSAPNVSNITVHTAPVLLGNLYGLDVTPLEPLAEAINRGGIPCQTTDNVSAALWAKMLYNCSLNPLGAVLNLHYGALTKAPEGIAILSGLIDEIFAVMTAAGYSTYWATAEDYKKEFFGKLVPDTYNHNASTLQDIRKKQPTEIDTLTGKILELAAEHGISVPMNTMLYRQIKTIQANY